MSEHEGSNSVRLIAKCGFKRGAADEKGKVRWGGGIERVIMEMRGTDWPRVQQRIGRATAATQMAVVFAARVTLAAARSSAVLMAFEEASMPVT